MATKFEKGNAHLMNKLNKIEVLTLIRESGEVSRAEIVRRTGLSAPTVTRIVESLIEDDGLVTQVGVGDSTGGRPPVIIRFNSDAFYVIGIDWGRTHIMGVLYNLGGKSLYRIDMPTNSEIANIEDELEVIYKLIDNIISTCNISISSLRGIGVAAAGHINSGNSIIEFSANFGWHNVDILTPLKERYNVPISVVNMANAMAKGELLYGAGLDSKDFIFVNVGYGLGASIVSDGKLFLGHDGYAGELGHTKISGLNRGRRCVCGKEDCLESYASGRGLVESANEIKGDYPDSMLSNLDAITAKDIADAAEQGDALAVRVIGEAAEFLGSTIAAMANVFNPRSIIIGGGVIRPDKLYYKLVKECIHNELLRNVSREIDVIPTGLCGEAAVKGAMSAVLFDILQFADTQTN